MNLAEWCKLKRDNEHLSEEEFAILAWKKQRESTREFIMQREQERFEKAAEKKIEQEIDKNLEKAVEKALLSGKSTMNIKINL